MEGIKSVTCLTLSAAACCPLTSRWAASYCLSCDDMSASQHSLRCTKAIGAIRILQRGTQAGVMSSSTVVYIHSSALQSMCSTSPGLAWRGVAPHTRAVRTTAGCKEGAEQDRVHVVYHSLAQAQRLPSRLPLRVGQGGCCMQATCLSGVAHQMPSGRL